MIRKLKRSKLKQYRSNNKWYRRGIVVIILVLIAFITEGSSLLTNNQQNSSNEDYEIRINDITLNPELTTCGFDIFNPNHQDDSFTVNLELPELECVVV